MNDTSIQVDLTKLAEEINIEHELCNKAARATIEHARNIGNKLLLVKSALKHGNYYDWIKANCDFSERTASTYVSVARHWDEFYSKPEVTSDLTISGFIQAVRDWTYHIERAAEKAKPVTERNYHDLNSQEKKILWQIGTEPHLVQKYLYGIRETRLRIQTAIEVAKSGQFSPEAINYTIRRHEELRQDMAQLEEILSRSRDAG